MSVADTFFIPEPIGLDFMRWASVVTEELSVYNVSIPASEDSWKSWALQVYNVNDLVEQGVPEPQGFDNWRAWAARVAEIAQG